MPDSPIIGDFTPSKRSRVKRLHQRAAYDKATVYGILDTALICHVAYIIDGQPYVTPTAHWREGDRVLWHGSSASRMLRTVKEKIPVSLNVSLFDGLVMARTGFHHSINYRSVTLFGHTEELTGEAEKLAALEAFTERVTPGRWAELRPPTSQEIKATTVVTMEIEEASAKVRTGPPVDDEEDYALPIWAGVVPVKTVIGEPIPDPRLDPSIAAPDNLKTIRVS
jgi:nitroimidazol reductase NimA-like FMN-containing flavoprotein (pyridoxamine 5'-phosphate oxidase superfamily)